MTQYREIIKQLTGEMRGIAIDATCAQCEHPEMAALIDCEPDIFVCRRCGYAQRNRPKW